jgi:hypothetical protein
MQATITNKLQKAYDLACSLIELPNSRKKHFSFLFIRNKPIQIGFNDSYKSHPLGSKFKTRYSSIHSELDLLKKIDFDTDLLRAADFVNVRIIPTTLELATARPCSYCINLLNYYGVKKVTYSTANNHWCEENF